THGATSGMGFSSDRNNDVANATGVAARHGALYVSRADARPAGGRALGYLEPRRSALRDGSGDPALQGRDAERLHRLYPNEGPATFIRCVTGCSDETPIHPAKGF